MVYGPRNNNSTMHLGPVYYSSSLVVRKAGLASEERMERKLRNSNDRMGWDRRLFSGAANVTLPFEIGWEECFLDHFMNKFSKLKQ